MATEGTRNASFRTTHDDQAPESRVLDETFWLRFGDNSAPSMREKIVYVTMSDVSRVGPAAFNVGVVCEALGISNSLINHHFGGRDELIAEAVVETYQRYVDDIWMTAIAQVTPESRLRAWIEASVARQVQMRGLAAILNYPTASLDVTNIVHQRHGQLMADLGALNMARLIQLVGDVRRDSVSKNELKLGEISGPELASDPHITVMAASIGWSVLGMSVWNTGPHLPTAMHPETAMLHEATTKYHVDRMIREARGE
jgi:AcrR family transcriptional regulator